MQSDQPNHDPWYQPRTAEIIQRGGEGFANSIGQGIRDLGAGIGQGLQQRRQNKMQEKQMEMQQGRDNLAMQQFAAQQDEKQKKIATDSKAAELFLLNDPERLQKIGKTPQQVKNASAEEQIGWAHAYNMDVAGQQVMQQLAQAKRAEANDAAALRAFSNASRGSMTIPNTTLPGIFPDQTANTVKTPTRDELWQALAAEDGAMQGRAAQPFLRQFAEAGDPMKQFDLETQRMNALTNRQISNNRLTPSSTQSSRPTITIDDTVNGKKVRRQLTDEQFNQWSEANPDAAKQKLQTNLAELRAQKAAGKKTFDLDELTGSGGKSLDLHASWGGKPIDDGIKYLESKLGGSKPRVRVVGPNGETGTIEDGDTLPSGWSIK